jgi:hypothetical protein
MSRIGAILRRLVGGDPETRAAWRLERERPGPDAQFEDRLRRRLEPAWVSAIRPRRLWLRVTLLAGAGLALLAVATAIAAN